MGSMCVSSCVCVCCAPSCYSECGVLSICSLLMFVSDAIGYHMVGTYSSMGLVMALYVAMIASLCVPHVVDVSALSICIVFRAFVVCGLYVFVVCVCCMCLLYVFVVCVCCM